MTIQPGLTLRPIQWVDTLNACVHWERRLSPALSGFDFYVLYDHYSIGVERAKPGHLLQRTSPYYIIHTMKNLAALLILCLTIARSDAARPLNLEDYYRIES